VVVTELPLSVYAQAGAVGLLVPSAGPQTSRAQALASLVRGQTRNSLRGGFPSGPVLIDVRLAGPDLQLGWPGAIVLLELPLGGARRNDVRYPIAVIGPGWHGLLTSESTRVPGLVSIADIAPTALALGGALGSRADADPVADLAELDARIRDNNRSRLPATLLAGALALLLAAVWPRASLLAFGTGLAANLAAGWTGLSAEWAVLLAVGLAMAAGGPGLAYVLRSRLAVGIALAAVVVAYLVSMGADATSVALSPLGPSQAGRFYGISNLLEAMLLLPAVAGAAFLRERLGWTGLGAAGVVSVVAVSGSHFGADGGGALVLAASYAVLAVGLAQARRWMLLPALAGTVAVAAAALAIDAAAGGSSHVTRAAGGGPGGLVSHFSDRLVIAYERTVAGWQPLLAVVVGLAGIAVLLALLLRRGVAQEERALPLAVAAGVLVSLVVNDSPSDVALTGLVACIAAYRCKLADRCAALWPSSSCSARP